MKQQVPLSEKAPPDHNVRAELQRLSVGTFTGPAGTYRQTTTLTTAQRAILQALEAPAPPRFLHLDAANG